jgi:hypothetical protein
MGPDAGSTSASGALLLWGRAATPRSDFTERHHAVVELILVAGFQPIQNMLAWFLATGVLPAL